MMAIVRIVALVALTAMFSTDVVQAQTKPLPENGTRLVLLGTAGGPSAKPARAQPANAVIVNDDIYIVDAGDGVVRQLALGGYPLRRVRAIFITHNHSDHVAGYGPLLLRAWLSGRNEPMQTFGPPPLTRMTADYLEHMRWDIDLRVGDVNRPPLDPLVKANEIEKDGVVYEDENLTVEAFTVDHGAAQPAYGFRVETGDRTIVFSGDTRPHKT